MLSHHHKGKSSDREEHYEAGTEHHIALDMMGGSNQTTVKLMRQVPQSSATLLHDVVDGNQVTTQGDVYFGSQGVNADADVDDEDVIVRCDNIHKTYLLGVEVRQDVFCFVLFCFVLFCFVRLLTRCSGSAGVAGSVPDNQAGRVCVHFRNERRRQDDDAQCAGHHRQAHAR